MAIFGLISLGAAAGAGFAGYVGSKDFTLRKLRFVDAGAIAAVVAAPVVWLLPLVGAGTALLFGAGVALGMKSAQRDRHLLP